MPNSTWTANRKANGWGSGLVEWTEGDTAYLSVVFSWLLPKAYSRAVWWATAGYHVRAGGPAVAFNPGYLAGVAEIGGAVDALAHHNPDAMFTSRGCVRKCSFCAVPKVEGDLVELDTWPLRPIVCDNNLLACSMAHFNHVIDSLMPIRGVDFNQGLDARLLTRHHAEWIARLDLKAVRLAWDHTALEDQFLAAFWLLRNAGIAAGLIHVYVLIGWNDTPADALYRLQTVADLGAYPNPMRYQPLGSLHKNEYVAPGWTDAELKRYMRYWSNLRITRRVPFAEFKHRGDEPGRPIALEQAALL